MTTFIKETGDKILKLSLTISGQWINSENRDWKGNVISAEPLVAIVMLQRGNVISWCKSDRDSGEGQRIRLSLLPYDKTNLEVQVNFSAENGYVRLASFVESAKYKPQIEIIHAIETGKIYKFAEIRGNPNITLSIFFIAQQNVKFGRNGIWHLKPVRESSMSINLNEIFASGRSGQIKIT